MSFDLVAHNYCYFHANLCNVYEPVSVHVYFISLLKCQYFVTRAWFSLKSLLFSLLISLLVGRHRKLEYLVNTLDIASLKVKAIMMVQNFNGLSILFFLFQ